MITFNGIVNVHEFIFSGGHLLNSSPMRVVPSDIERQAGNNQPDTQGNEDMEENFFWFGDLGRLDYGRSWNNKLRRSALTALDRLVVVFGSAISAPFHFIVSAGKVLSL